MCMGARAPSIAAMTNEHTATRGAARETRAAPGARAGRRVTRRGGAIVVAGAAAGAAVSIGALALARGRATGTPAGQLAAAAPATTGRALTLDADTLVFEREEIDLGRVPLNKQVPVTVKLTNYSQRTVTLGRPTAEAAEGC